MSGLTQHLGKYSQRGVMFPCVWLSEVLGTFLRVEPNRQDGFEGMEGLTGPSKPSRVLVDLFLFVSCETDGRPMRAREIGR